jgi:hypothetical protein
MQHGLIGLKNGVEEAADIGFNNPAIGAELKYLSQFSRSSLRAFARAIAVTEIKKILFVYRFENSSNSTLNNLVFQTGDAEGPQLAVAFGNVFPANGPGAGVAKARPVIRPRFPRLRDCFVVFYFVKIEIARLCTASTTVAGILKIKSTFRSARSMHFSWSERITPLTLNPTGIGTSKGYPLALDVIGQTMAKPTF